MQRPARLLLAAALSLSPFTVCAQDNMTPHPGAAAGSSDMMGAMERMNRDMSAAPMTGAPDHDFLAMMIPHHQGAVDMARAYLRTGRNPAIRRFAQSIITNQDREIRQMRAWLASGR